MLTYEHSFGPIYLATEEATQRWFWPHLGVITEMCEPYRVGKCIILPSGTFKLVAVGIWHRDIYDDVIEDFPGGWPDWMKSWDIDEHEEMPGFMKGRPLTKDELDAFSPEEDTGGVEGPECGGVEGPSEETL